MGRVGLVSKMPFTFAVEVVLFTPEADGALKALDLPVTARDGGVCITGRDGKGADLTRLILTEASVDEILRAIPGIEATQIHERARETLKRLQASSSFRSHLQRGLSAPGATPKGSLGQLKVPAEKVGEEEPRDEIVGLIARNPGELASLSGNDLKNGALVIVLTDLEPPLVMVGDAEAGGPGAAEAETVEAHPVAE